MDSKHAGTSRGNTWGQTMPASLSLIAALGENVSCLHYCQMHKEKLICCTLTATRCDTSAFASLMLPFHIYFLAE